MEQSNNGKEMCRKCHGRGYHIRGSIYLKTICEYCRGRKDVDWIDYVSGNPSPRPYDMNVKRELVAQNVQSLITEINLEDGEWKNKWRKIMKDMTATNTTAEVGTTTNISEAYK